MSASPIIRKPRVSSHAAPILPATSDPDLKPSLGLSVPILASGGAAVSGMPVSGLVQSMRVSARGRPSKRSEAHTSELQSLMRISYAVFCLKKKKIKKEIYQK